MKPINTLLSRTASLLCLLALGTTAAHAAEVEPGQVYQGPQQLQAKELGLSFMLPEGFTGSLDASGEFFNARSNHAEIRVYGDTLSLAEIRGLMQAPIALDDFSVLQPTGAVSKRDGWLHGEYTLGGHSNVRAVVRANASAAGIGLVFITLGKELKQLDNLAGMLQQTAVLGKPEPKAAGSWSQELNNQVIKRYYRGSGYYEEFTLVLCADGRFYRGTSSGGFGGGASGAYAGDAQGRWRASGNTSGNGELVLQHGAGSVFRASTPGSDWEQTGAGGEVRSYRLQYLDDGLHLDGVRWYWGDEANC